MNLFPTLKRGYCNRDTIYQLLVTYQYINNVEYPDIIHDDLYPDIIPDDLYLKAFNSQIPAQFYYNDQNGWYEIIPMTDAIN